MRQFEAFGYRAAVFGLLAAAACSSASAATTGGSGGTAATGAETGSSGSSSSSGSTGAQTTQPAKLSITNRAYNCTLHVALDGTDLGVALANGDSQSFDGLTAGLHTLSLSPDCGHVNETLTCNETLTAGASLDVDLNAAFECGTTTGGAGSDCDYDFQPTPCN